MYSLLYSLLHTHTHTHTHTHARTQLIKDKTAVKQIQKFSERLVTSAGVNAEEADSEVCSDAMALTEKQHLALEAEIARMRGEDAPVASKSRVKTEEGTKDAAKKSSRRKLHSTNRRNSLSDNEGDEENMSENTAPVRTKHARSSKASAQQKIRESAAEEEDSSSVKVKQELQEVVNVA